MAYGTRLNQAGAPPPSGLSPLSPSPGSFCSDHARVVGCSALCPHSFPYAPFQAGPQHLGRFSVGVRPSAGALQPPHSPLHPPHPRERATACSTQRMGGELFACSSLAPTTSLVSLRIASGVMPDPCGASMPPLWRLLNIVREDV